MLRKTRRMLEAERGNVLNGELVEHFITRKLNEGAQLQEIAKDLKITTGAISYWLLKLGIHRGDYTAAGASADGE